MRFTILLLTLLFLGMSEPSAVAGIKPKQIALKNGITLFIIEHHTLPIVSVELLMPVGSIHDPTGRSGVASMTASLLDEGTKNRTSKQISEEVDYIGAGLGASADLESTAVSLRVLKKDIEKGFNLLSDIVLYPSFETKEFERVRQLVLGSIHSEKDSPGVIADRAFNKIVFGSHPYANPVIGTEETVTQMTQADLISFYQTRYLPKGSFFSIVGDVTEKEAVRLVEKYFAKWGDRSKGAPKTASVPKPVSQPRKTELIQKDLTQTTVLMGHLGIRRNHSDFYPIAVMNYILGGGGFSSRLLTHIRDNKGLVYSVYSAFSPYRQEGSFEITLQTKASNTNEAIAAVQEEIALIRKTGVTETELAEAKAYMIGSFPLRLETTTKLSKLLSSVGFHELGLAYFDDYPKYIEKVTQESILKAAQTYLSPDQISLVVVGNLEAAKIKVLP
ncbi:MAG: pitrilysin family protein [Nitrospirota bacterium]